MTAAVDQRSYLQSDPLSLGYGHAQRESYELATRTTLPARSSPFRLDDSDSDGGYCTPTKLADVCGYEEEEEEEEVGHRVVRGGEESRNTKKVGTGTEGPAGDPGEKLPQTAKPEMVVVDSELRDKIITQVEYFFSDENLAKDSFLMKHIRRNKHGYVSLKLVASFRKIKSLSKDWRVVLASLRNSDLLLLSDDETKIRRVVPAPRTDNAHIRRTVVVTEYPAERPTVKEIEEEFGRYGEVSLVRILQPGKAIPPDVKHLRSKHPELGAESCILVEYDTVDSARDACKSLSAKNCWRQEMAVQMLEEPEQQQLISSNSSPRSGKRTITQHHRNESPSQSPNNANREERAGYKPTVKISEASSSSRSPSLMARHKQSSTRPLSRVEKVSSSSSNNNSQKTTKPLNKHNNTNKNSNITNSNRWRKEELSVHQTHWQKQRHDSWRDDASDSGYSHRSPTQSPKVSPGATKKFFVRGGEEGCSWRSGEKTSASKATPCIVRQPLGPDGTRGFHRR